jgi:DNA-binding NtrC family response regulator
VLKPVTACEINSHSTNTHGDSKTHAQGLGIQCETHRHVEHQQTIEAHQMDLLIVDGDNEFRRYAVRRLKPQGRSVRDANVPSLEIELVRKRSFEVEAIDLMMPEVNGIELLGKLKEIDAACEVVMLTDESSVETAVAAMKRGVFDHVSKPSVR